MVTAETAAVLPVVVILLAVVLAGLRLGIQEVQCVDAARAGARSAARGDADVTAREHALRAAPEHAAVSIAREGSNVVVTVTAPGVPLLGILPTPSSQAVAATEGGGEGAPDPQ